MKNLFTKKSLLKMAILGGASFCIVILFAACKNFLNAKETKSQIDAAIAYANSSEYTIYIKYSGKNGVVKSPAGSEISKKVTDTFTLSFDPMADFEFLNWKITDDATGEELENGEYLKIENLSESETACTFTKAPKSQMKLCLTPVVTERPQILTYAPILTSEMSLMDSSIQVIFDHEMDEASIYYTQEELAELMSELELTDPADSALLKTEQNKYYGYMKAGKKYYKSISVSNNATGENLNDCFTIPVFETKKLLSLKANENNLPPKYQQILINLDTNFFYTVNGKQISLANSKKWIYQVNNGRDTYGPKIVNSETELKIKNKASGYELLEPQANQLTGNEFTDFSGIKYSQPDNLNLTLNLMVKDDECGLNPAFNFKLKKVYDTSYRKIANPTYTVEKTINFDQVSLWDANYSGIIESENLEDGLYSVELEFKDQRNNESTNQYYFAKDYTAPSEEMYKIWAITDYILNGNGNYKIYWKAKKTQKTPLDFSLLQVIHYKNSGTFNARESLYREDEIDKQLSIETTTAETGKIEVYLSDRRGNKYSSSFQPSLLNRTNFVYVHTGLYEGKRYPSLHVSKYEVQSDQYAQKMKLRNGSNDAWPASQLSFYEALMYCNLLSSETQRVYYIMIDGEPVYDVDTWVEKIEGINKDTGTGKYYCDINNILSVDILEDETKTGFRLPHPDEWRYIAKAAGMDEYTYSGSDTLSDVAVYDQNNPSAVGKKQPNTLGIYDMTGNVAEWTYDKNRLKQPLYLGGAYNDPASSNNLKIMGSNSWVPCGRSANVGFRIVCTAFDY